MPSLPLPKSAFQQYRPKWETAEEVEFMWHTSATRVPLTLRDEQGPQCLSFRAIRQVELADLLAEIADKASGFSLIGGDLKVLDLFAEDDRPVILLNLLLAERKAGNQGYVEAVLDAHAAAPCRSLLPQTRR